MSTERPKALPGILGAVMIVLLAVGAWWGFPVYDDAYLLLFVREGGAARIAADHPDRPAYGALLQMLASLFGPHRAPYIAMAAGWWALFAWQSSRLWGRLFPARDELAPLVAMLTVAPILVSIQYTTLTTVIPVGLPVSLCLAGVLLILRSEAPGSTTVSLLAAGLAAAATVFSEYGIAAAAASAALLLGLRRLRSAALVVLGSSAGYLVFRLLSDITVRTKVIPSVQLGRVLEHPLRALSLCISGIWYSLIGAYGDVVARIRLDPQSRSSLVALAIGGLAAPAIWAVLGRDGEKTGARAEVRSAGPLVMAVAAGLLVVAMTGNSPVDDDPYRSRYRLPIVPFAVAATVSVLDGLVTRRFRRVLFAGLAFVSGWQMVGGGFQVRREQQQMEDIGARLLPFVRESSGIVVGVVPDMHLEGSDITPKVTLCWNDEEARRVWVLPLGSATKLFGPRLDCRNVEDIDLPFEFHSASRKGPIARLLWLPTSGTAATEPESYCVRPFR